jgi:hypothetical protein
MNEVDSTLRRPWSLPSLRKISPWEFALGVVVAIVAALFMLRAFSDHTSFDVGLAYQGGEEALRTGHPEHLHTWISTPFLGMVMAGVAAIMSVETAATLLSVLNVVLMVGVIGAVWGKLRPQVSRRWWWTTLILAVLYAPAISSLWWKQMNLLALALAVLGFWLAGGGRHSRAGLAVAVSIGIKPLVILLPFVMLVQRRTRRAAVAAFAWGAGLLAVSQAFMAVQAGNLAAFSPLPELRTFSERAQPANIWACHPENYAPGSLLCRLVGGENWNWQRSVVLMFVAVLGFVLFDALRGREGGAWPVFACACLLSPMISPIAWSHYQVLLAPLFLVLAFELARGAAPAGPWALLVTAYVLVSITWRPYGTLPGAILHVVTGRVQNQTQLFGQFAVAQFAQYVLAMAAIAWFSHVRATTVRISTRDA